MFLIIYFSAILLSGILTTIWSAWTDDPDPFETIMAAMFCVAFLPFALPFILIFMPFYGTFLLVRKLKEKTEK